MSEQAYISSRIAAFVSHLTFTGMSRENIAVQGYSFALAYFRGVAERSIQAGESIPNELDCTLMEQAAEVIAQVMQHLSSTHPKERPPLKYCPTCKVWRDLDGIRCEVCKTTLMLMRLNEQKE